MRTFAFICSILWMPSLCGFAGAVQAFSDNELEYQQCLLDHQPEVQLEQVVARVRQACDKIYRDNLMLPRKKAYFQCVLNYLPPVETDSAVQDVLGACASKHDFRR
jgi:hypothetical protein